MLPLEFNKDQKYVDLLLFELFLTRIPGVLKADILLRTLLTRVPGVLNADILLRTLFAEIFYYAAILTSISLLFVVNFLQIKRRRFRGKSLEYVRG